MVVVIALSALVNAFLIGWGLDRISRNGGLRRRERPVTPMRLLRIPEPFDNPDWIFEPKMVGFWALAQVRPA